MKISCVLCAALSALLLLTACGRSAPETEAPQEEIAASLSITPEEGAAILEEQLGTGDAATGNVMSYGYEGTVTIDGVDYYNYRVSWLVEGHLSYLTNYLVSTDGLVVQEYLPEAD